MLAMYQTPGYREKRELRYIIPHCKNFKSNGDNLIKDLRYCIMSIKNTTTRWGGGKKFWSKNAI